MSTVLGFTDLPNFRKPSKVPCRQQPDSPEDPKPRSTSQEAELPSSSSKPTPVRAVFHDLHTAHSSITSGNKRTLSGRRAISHNLFEPPERCDSIPLQKIERRRGATVESFLQNIPLPPPPAALFQGRYGSDTENSTPVPRSRSQRLPLTVKGEPGSLLANVKTALTSISSPITPDTKDEEDKAPHWPQDNPSLPKGTFGKKTPGYMELLKENDEVDPSTPEARRSGRCGNGGDKSIVQYQGNDFSIYHSNLGEAPSGSLLPSSDEGGSPGDLTRRKSPNLARHTLYTPYQGEIQSPIRKSSSETTPQRHSYDIQRATSTVGNIYKHYLRCSGVKGYESDSEEETNEESPLRGDIATKSSNHRDYISEFNLDTRLNSGEMLPTALNIQKQRKVVRVAEEPRGQPPTRTLPEIPTLPVSKIAPSVSQGIGTSSSYGDTHKLLDLTQTTKAGSRGAIQQRTNDVHSDEDDSEVDIAAQLHVPPFPFTTPNNAQPMPKVIISPADDPSVYGDDPHWTDPVILRQPLEREVSKALRRASGYSVYSMESVSTSFTGQNENNRPQRPGLNFSRKLNVEDTPPSDAGSLNTEQREFVAQAQAFYDRGAIAPNWVTAQHQNVVRIPISHSINLPDSPPESPYEQALESSEKHATPTEAEDWETVAESAAGPFGRSRQNEPGMMMGGLVNRAGSSIADNSDDGTESTEPLHIDEYGSSERIAQHPGNIEYYGDYRQRDLKKTHIPVFLPVFREHKVNGYLADSNRTRPPPGNYNYNPQPLGKAHVNPFKSPPPKMKSSHGRNLSLFPPSLHTSEESADFTTSNQGRQVSSGNQGHVDDRLRFDWTGDLGEPGLALGGPNDEIPGLIKKRSSSWQYVLALGEKMASPKRVPITAASTNTSKHKEINIELKAPGATKPQDHKPFIKGPPGAFYRDLHMNSKHEPRRVSLIQANRPAKVPDRNNSTKDYPTNALRPLALLASATNASSAAESHPIVEQPSTPVRSPNHRGTQSDNSNDFVYRSPLAPPKRPSWQDLYSPQRLQEMQNAAIGDGFFESQPVIGGGPRDSKGNTWKHLFENPKLSPWSQNPAHIILEARRKRSISITVLALCNLFPPTLLLYATGRMDGIIVWWTDGDFSSFALKQKRYAWLLLACWMCVIAIGLVVFLVVFFTRLRH
ncbi:hypothetical protein MFRU_002g03980 [Monilinia fructicola]|uniref:Uncharacterized protein n=1 Tax=Monilinia fructicola TaxID=38448 RepID=A0A5M9K3B3_MONFR|nr:hypothetical protein EYC84_004181 [Monilinia fructicola]KAG4035050.1 hypothetical protein MFRU_002g03980 [Monilinia fructicola]